MEKQMIRNMFKKLEFVRIAFVASVGLPLFITSVNAQNPSPAPGEATAAAVVVTGSNIPTAEEVTANPLDTLTTADIDRSGASDVLNVLIKRNPDFVGAGNVGNSNANIASGTTQGGAIIAIRGLPTLVLLGGRRIADSAAIASGGAQFTDVNLFPTSLISRIEVLKDGASALYGSEAVGGVVNIFLKDDFNGVDVGYRYGFTVESGIAERKAWVIAGVGNDTTHVTAGFQYDEQDALFLRERAYSRVPGGVTTTFGGVGRDNLLGGTKFYLLQGEDPLQPFGGAAINSPFDNPAITGGMIAPPPPDPTGTNPANPGQYAQLPFTNGQPTYSRVAQGVITSYDLSQVPTSTLDLANTNAYASFDHQIFGKQLEVFGEFLFTHNHNLSFLNAQPLNNGTGVIILGSQRVDPNTGNLVAENRGTPAPFNPFQLSIDSNTLVGNYRLFANNRYQTNPRTFMNDSTFYRVLGGIKSQINKDWYAEVAAYYSHYGIDFVNGGLVNATALNDLINNGNGSGIAPTATTNDGGYLDFFALDPTAGPRGISQAAYASIFGEDIRRQDSYQRVFDAKIVGFPIELPGGPLGVSVGAEYRIEGFKINDSPEIFVGSVPIEEVNRGRFIDSFYGELAIPIVGSEMNIPGIYNLEVRLAGRYDHYEGISTDAKVPKYSIRYQPIKDVTLRGTYSNSFVAPTLIALFGPPGEGFSDVVDFHEGAGPEDQAQVLVPTNPGLTPATAESYTAGIVYSPHFVPGLTITVDFFKTLEQNIVGTLGGGTILTSVEKLGTASPYYNLVTFGNFQGQTGATPITGPGPNNSGGLTGNLAATFYIDQLLNVGAQRETGWDLTAHYTVDLQRWGQLELGVNSVVFVSQDLRINKQSPYYNISGLVGSEFFGTNPDYKITFLLEHRWQGFTLSLNANYIPEMLNATGATPATDDQSTYDTVDDYWTMDGRLSYTFHCTPAPGAAVDAKDAKDGKSIAAAPGMLTPLQKMLDNTTLTVGCNNMFDETPPFVAGANSATNLATYDPFGSFVYFEINKKF
jgi:iron complex outermembrane receptor protein